MCEKPKDEKAPEKGSEKESDRRSYYYDDAHGYKDYDPAEEAEDADESA